MVIDLQVTPSKCTNHNGRKVYPDTNGAISHHNQQQSQYVKDQLSIIRSNLLNPVEVTFCNVDDENQRHQPRRTRLTTISSEASDSDSISSSITVRPASSQGGKKKVPDGGYGWVIVFASLMVSLIADGVSFSFGLIYTELLGYFNEGPAKTAWVGSLFFAIPLLAGPIMSNFVDRWGCRKMTIVGGLVACVGFILSSMSTSLEILYLTFGVISGLGLGLIYVTAVVSVAFWFDKKRTFATGIGASGTGLGTFLYAPLTQWLITTFGWRGATLILAGTLLNMCVMGALMRDPEWLVEENKLESRSQSIQTFSNSSVCLDEIKKLLETGAPNEDVLETLVTNFNTEANQQIRDTDIIASKKYQSEVLLPTFMSNNEPYVIKGIRSNSRRSLRPDKLMSPETMSHEEFLSPQSFNKAEQKDRNHKCKIASIETLNPSEKASTNFDFDTMSLNLSIDDDIRRSLVDSDEGYVTCRRSGMHGSRFSLNETMTAKQTPSIEAIRDDLRRSFRGNSLNILYENETFHPEQNSTPRRTRNGSNVSDIIIPIPNSISKMRNSHKTHKHSATIPNGNLKRNSSLRYSNYLKNMRIHRNSIHYRGAMLNTHRYRLKASSCPNIYRNSMTTIAKEDDKWYEDFLEIVKSIFDFSLFLDYKFFMMSLSTLFLFTWYIVPYFYITEHLLKFNYTEEDAAYLISVIGIFNTIGMIFLGWIGDREWLNVTKTYACCLILCGLSMFLMPFATTSYPWLIVLCVLFGITFASSFSFTPIITSRLVDLDDFTCAYGLILLVQGIGSLIGAPLAGLIFSYTERWDDSFFIGGVFIALSGLIAYVIGTVHAPTVDEDENNNDESSDEKK